MGYMLHAIRDRVALDVAQAAYDARMPAEGDDANDEVTELMERITSVRFILDEAWSALLRDDVPRYCELEIEAIEKLGGKP